jgi:hypothetical protein
MPSSSNPSYWANGDIKYFTLLLPCFIIQAILPRPNLAEYMLKTVNYLTGLCVRFPPFIMLLRHQDSKVIYREIAAVVLALDDLPTLPQSRQSLNPSFQNLYLTFPIPITCLHALVMNL